MPQSRNPICVALDTPDPDRAAELATALKPHVGMLKIGMEFFYRQGLDGYRTVAETGVPIFLDLKLHDIPNTVAQGLTSLLQLTPAPAILNVHASGGPDMLRAAADAVAGRARLIAVTILTSLSEADVQASGFDPERSTADLTRRLASLSMQCGLDGVVCSPHDLPGIREDCGDDFLTVVPGIRPTGSATGDQKRIATPASAMADGADILVIGRPITQSADPAAAAAAVLEDIQAA